MDCEDNGTEREWGRYQIDVGWFERNGRSFTAMAERCLCPACRKRLSKDRGKWPPESYLATIRDCCSGAPGFISGTTPIMESVFRLFLANGNQSLDLIDLGSQLSDRRGVDTYRTSVEVLSRLLEHDRSYGIQPVED